MARKYGILGQSNPDATTLTAVYTVPAGKHATARVLVCNQSTATTFRISLAAAGETDATEQYVAYGQALAANDSVSSVAFTVGATDVVRVYAGTGNVSFTVTGIEDDDA